MYEKALRIESTWAFVFVIAGVFAVVGGIFGWIVDAGYKNSAEYKADHAPMLPEAIAPTDIHKIYICG